jgi:hypothetical protein
MDVRMEATTALRKLMRALSLLPFVAVGFYIGVALAFRLSLGAPVGVPVGWLLH